MPYRPQHATYPTYFDTYLGPMPADAKPMTLLQAQLRQIDALRTLHAAQADHTYAPGKWTLKQMVGHLSDAERVFAYRAMCIAHGETQSLPGFDEDSYVAQGGFENRDWAELCDELRAARQATLALFAHMPAAQLARVGQANGKAISVEALLYILPAHFDHHMRVLAARYGVAV